jgi:hypothetical protein
MNNQYPVTLDDKIIYGIDHAILELEDLSNRAGIYDADNLDSAIRLLKVIKARLTPGTDEHALAESESAS